MKTLFLFAIVFSLQALNAADATGPIHFRDQTDQTDTYAIPLDSSEAEENQEMKEFQEESNAYQRR